MSPRKRHHVYIPSKLAKRARLNRLAFAREEELCHLRAKIELLERIKALQQEVSKEDEEKRDLLKVESERVVEP